MNKEALRKELEDFYAEVITFCEQEGIGQEDRDRKWYAKKVKDFGDECIDELINKIEMSNEQLHPLFKDILDKAAKPLDDGQEGEGLAIEFYKWAENLSPSERCTVHAPAGSGAGTGVYVLSTEELYDKYLDYKNRASQTTLTTALPVGDGEGEKVDGMRELFKLVWLDGFHGVARDMENDLTRRLALLPSAVTGGVKWVSVGERLPEEDVDVIGFFPDKTEGGEYVAMAIRSGNKLHSAFPNSTAAWFEATHWMSLPPHPSEGQPAQE